MAWASKTKTCKGSRLLCSELLDMVLDTKFPDRKRELLLICNFHSVATTSNVEGVPKQGLGQHRGLKNVLKAFSESSGSLKLEQPQSRSSECHRVGILLMSTNAAVQYYININ